MRILFFLLLCLATVGTLSAQEEKWVFDGTSALEKINWIEQTNTGTVVVASAKGLTGLDHTTGAEIWSVEEAKNVNRNSYFNVEGMPFFYVESAVAVTGVPRGFLINAGTGKVLYDTREDKLRVKNYTFLPETGSLIFEAMKGKNERFLINFSLNTESVKWIASVGKNKGLGDMLKDLGGLSSFVTQGPMFSKEGTVILGIKDVIYAIDDKSGEVKWEMETDKKIKALVYSEANNSLYLGIRKEKKLTVLAPESGDDITPGKLKLKGTMLDVVKDNSGNLVLVETEGFNLIDPKTNEFMWKKSYKIEALDEVIPMDNGFIAIGKDDKGSEIHFVDKTGDKIWDSKVKGYAYFATPTPKGVMYISTGRSNILNYKDGKDVWDKDVKFKSLPAVAIDDNTGEVFLYENKNAYTFNFETGKIKLIGEDIIMDKVNKRTFLEAEVVDGGYFVSADQNASLIGSDGKLKYTSHYPPMVAVDLLSVAGTVGNLAGLPAGVTGSIRNMEQLNNMNKQRRQTGATVTRKTSSGSVSFNGGPSQELYSISTTRFTNSQQTKEHKFLTTRYEDGIKSLLMIDKNTGEVIKRIELVEKNPNYVVDVVDNVIFVTEKDKLVRAYSMD
jgi:outer membrane protein assembly factor BamB